MKIFARTNYPKRPPLMTPVERTLFYDTLMKNYIDERRIWLKELGEKRLVEERLLNQRINESERVERIKEYGKGDFIDKMV